MVRSLRLALGPSRKSRLSLLSQLFLLSQLSLLVSLGLLCLAPSARAAQGDLDNDGKVTNNDAMMALLYGGGIAPAPNGSLANGDVSTPADGHIDLLDATRILRVVNNLDTFGTSGGTATALMPVIDSFTMTANTVKNYKLLSGYHIKGKVTFSPTPGAITETLGSIDFKASSGVAYSGSVATDGTYDVVVSPGTYTPTVSTTVQVVNMQTFEFYSYDADVPLTPSVTVTNADVTQNYARPALPATGTISGTVSGDNFTPFAVNGSIDSGPYAGSGSSGMLQGAAYSVHPVAGPVTLGVSGNPTGASSTFVSASWTTPINLAAGASVTQDLTVPHLETISGTITVPTGAPSASMAIFSQTPAGMTLSTSSQVGSGGAYQLYLPQGPANTMIFLAAQTVGAASISRYYRTIGTVPATGTPLNFTLPAYPASTLTLSGKITDPSGAAVTGATVSVSQQVTSGSGWIIVASVKTDAAGMYSLPVPSGTIGVVVSPPSA